MNRTPAWLLAMLTIGATAKADESARREFFEARIRPVLAARCYACHGARKHDGGLRVDWRDGLRVGGDSGPAIEPGPPEQSLLVRVLEHAEPGVEMPKKAAKLPDRVVADFRAWVASGAFDPRDKPPSAAESATLEWEAKLAERRSWWSLQPLSRPTVPAGDSAQPVDRFVTARLRAEGLDAAPPAERSVLVRRLSFVLTGLPPSPGEVRAFVDDRSPNAYEKLVDRLLASPHFGEHWARHWMDVVRYGDTYGYEWDIPAKGAWRYRDYLVRAFNADVPFDQLAREQIAGDLLPAPRINAVEGINESLVGPMFFQLGENRHGDSAMFDGIHQEMLHNKIDAFSKAFQGLTVGCARCHDHKLDAVSQRDYYALAGAFMSPRWVTNTIDAPGRNASVIAELRRIKISLRDAIAGWWRDRGRTWADELLAAQGPAGKALTAAGAEPPWEHPLRPWVELSKAARAKGDVAKTWTDAAARHAAESERRAAENKAFRVVADFTKGTPPGWSIDGVGLRDGPVRSGDFVVALEGPAAVKAILPAGMFTHALSPRLNGAVRTPYLNQFPEPLLSLETCGGDFSAERVMIDNAFISERQTYLARDEPAWSGFSTFPEMAGRRNYVELATKTSNPNFPPRIGLGGACSEAQIADPRSWFGITRAVAHKGPGAPKDELTRFHALFEGQAPKTLEEAAGRHADWWRASLNRWAKDGATDDDVRLLNGLLSLKLLPNQAEADAPPRVRELVAAYRRAERRLLEPQTVNGLADLDPGGDYRLNVRGEYDQLGPAIPRGYLHVFADSESGAAFRGPRSGRLELAERVVSPDNPLTARVYVNRVWQWVFGAGIVATPDDFGRLGEPPTHPDLLDYLSHWSMDHGWSTKGLVWQLVLSETFRQSSSASPRAREVDPRNRLLHHYLSRRLEAESVRDAILAASGRLDRRLYGPPIDPHRPREDPQKRLVSGPIDGQSRRSLYIKLTIMEPPAFLAAFNQPPPKIPTGRRDVTNVPAQALALLNDPFVIEQARAWGERVVAGPERSTDARLNAMFMISLGREPSAREQTRWQGLVRDLAEQHRVPPDKVADSVPLWADAAHTLFNVKEFIYIR